MTTTESLLKEALDFADHPERFLARPASSLEMSVIKTLATRLREVEREGWVTVPVEATPEMISVASEMTGVGHSWIPSVYRAMIAAAPKARG